MSIRLKDIRKNEQTLASLLRLQCGYKLKTRVRFRLIVAVQADRFESSLRSHVIVLVRSYAQELEVRSLYFSIGSQCHYV